VGNGQELILVRRQPGSGNQIDLIVARVENSNSFKYQAAWELQTLGGDHIVPGDSGGGVWLDGQLVGNNWAIEMVEDGGLLGLTASEKAPNGTIYAAQYPAEIKAQLGGSRTDLTSPGSVDDTESPRYRFEE
jgi:hypothetical protein